MGGKENERKTEGVKKGKKKGKKKTGRRKKKIKKGRGGDERVTPNKVGGKGEKENGAGDNSGIKRLG